MLGEGNTREKNIWNDNDNHDDNDDDDDDDEDDEIFQA